MANQIPANQGPQLVQIDAQTFAAKYSGKREVYRFLASDVGAYLPGYSHCTIWHLKELVGNQRKLLLSKDVKHVTLPLFEGLYIHDLLQFAQNHNNGEIMRALPSVEKEIHKLPREYIGNVIQTLAKDVFTRWVKARIETRNTKLTTDRELAINMDTTIANIFNTSNAISVTRGISSHLMKSVSKRRRSKYQIQEDKRREEQKKAETKRRLDQVVELEASIRELQTKVQRTEEVEQQVQGFIDQGLLVMDAQGNPQMNVEAVLDSERNSIASQPAGQQQIQPIADRRRAQQFSMNDGGDMDEDADGDVDIE